MKIKRNKNGFIQSVVITELADTYSMDCSLATIIEAHLKAFRKSTRSHPASMSEEEWDQILKKMQKSFAMISDEEHLKADCDLPKIEEGLDLFRKHYFHLWS